MPLQSQAMCSTLPAALHAPHCTSNVLWGQRARVGKTTLELVRWQALAGQTEEAVRAQPPAVVHPPVDVGLRSPGTPSQVTPAHTRHPGLINSKECNVLYELVC